MSRYAFSVAVGPVGAFIAAGRRSRDLWYGSRYLSEVTRLAANALAGRSGAATRLAVPLAGRIKESFLVPRDELHRKPTITNKIDGWFDAADDTIAAGHLRAAHQAAVDFLAGELKRLKDHVSATGVVVEAAIDGQIAAVELGDFIELYAAWVRVDGNDEAALDRARQLVAHRKMTRGFQVATSQPGRAVSSLDPGRPTVLFDADSRAHGLDAARAIDGGRLSLGVRPQERLDAISLARRLAVFWHTDRSFGLPRLPFPPLARVTADPWLDGIDPNDDDLGDILRTFDALLDASDGARREALFGLSSPSREPGRAPRARRFPYDPSVLFDGGLTAMHREVDRLWHGRRAFNGPAFDASAPGMSAEAATRQRRILSEMRAALARLAAPVEGLHRRYGTPEPYYALIEADGDGMGRLLGQLTGKPRDATLRALYDFADRAWEIVEDHHGCTFYAGGDELLAYAPLDRAIPLVRDLAAEFRRGVAREIERHLGSSTGLSVGVAICHVKYDLRAARRETHDALDEAKRDRARRGDGRPGLAIVEQPRGADARRVAGALTDLCDDLGVWRRLLARGDLSMSTAHALLRRADQLDSGTGDGLELASAELTLRRQRTGHTGDGDDPELDRLRERLHPVHLGGWSSVRGLAHEVLIAHRIERTAAQRRGRL